MPTDAAVPRAEAQLAQAYRRLERDLQNLIAFARQKGNLGSLPFLEAQLKEVRAGLRTVEVAERAFITDDMPSQYVLSARAAQGSLEAIGAGTLQPSFTGLDRRAVRLMQQRVSSNLSGIRAALTQGLALGDVRGASVAIQAALDGDGVLVKVSGNSVKVLTPSGRHWDPKAYARMLGRTAIADTRRVSFRQRYLQNGIDAVKIVANGTSHAACAVWEGRTVSLTGATPGIPTIADARAAGLFHPNCRHRYVADPDFLGEIPGAPQSFGEDPEPLPILGRQSRRPRERRAT